VFWLVGKLILIDACFRNISFMYTVYDHNKHYCCCEENYLLWLCLFVFSVLLFLKLYPCCMIIIHTPGYTLLY